MRIAFITPEFITEEYFSGGLANYVFRTATSISNLGHEVHVIILSRSKKSKFKFENIWVHPIAVNDRPKTLHRIIGHFLYDFNQWLAFAYKAWRKLTKLNKIHSFDIVQVPNYTACGLFVCALSRIPHVTRISSFQKEWNIASGQRRQLSKIMTEWIELLQLRLCKNIYAPSYCLANMLSEKAGINGVKVFRTPFYIETDKFDYSLYDLLHQYKYILYFGRYDIHKGIKVLGKALPKVLNKIPDCHFVFVGKNSANLAGNSIQNYIVECCSGQTDRLHFFDQARHEKLYPIISGAVLVVLPSLVDNLPNSMLEAMALKTPVIGTIGASFDEIIVDGQNGFLVQSMNTDALADTIISAWQNPNLDAIALNACQTIKQLQPEITVPALLEYFRNIARESKL